MKRQRSQGQALVEFIIGAMLFLVPLFLAVIVIGKLSNVRHTANMSARYATWERTVWYDDAGTRFGAVNGANHKSAAQINNEIAVRLINNRQGNATTIRSTDANATSFANGTDPLWRDNSGTRYLDNYQQLATSVTRTTPTTNIAGSAVGAIGALPIPVGVTGSLTPQLPNDTLALAEVTISRIGANSRSLQRLWPRTGVWGSQWNGFDFRANGGIVSNTWYANGSEATRQLASDMVPTAKGMGGFLSTTFTVTKQAWEVGAGPDIGRIAPDVVPQDRLR